MNTSTAGSGTGRVTFLLTTPDAIGGTEFATFQLASELARRTSLDISILGVFRDSDEHPLHGDRFPLHHLVDRRLERPNGGRPSQLIDSRWEPEFTVESDEAMRAWLNEHHSDVLIATTPALLAILCQLAGPESAIVGIEHRATAARGRSGEPLRLYGDQADAFVSLTPDGTSWFRSALGPDLPLLATIPNLITDEFVPRSSCTRPLIVAAGRMIGSKQFDHVVEAFAAARRPPWRLRIFGDGPERRRLQRTVLRRGVHDHVELVRFVPDLRYELAKSSMLVISSTAEGLPLVGLEALAAGVPIVSYDCPVGPRALIDHEVNGLLVPSNDVDSLADAIRRLIEDDDERRALGRAAAGSRSRFAAAPIVQQWSQLIETVMSQDRPRRLRRATIATQSVRNDTADPQPWVARGGLLLHIGPHKTGTTALQSAFWADREGLLQLGVRYPGRSPAPHGAVMARLGTSRGWDDSIPPGPMSAWEQLCVETRTAQETVVVSSEAFCHATVEQAARVGAELRHGPVRVAVTLRSLGHVIPSSWQEYIKSGWTTEYEEFLRAVLLEPQSASTPTPSFWVRHDHGQLVQRWVEAVGADNVVVVVADPQQPSQLFDSFERLLGLPPGALANDGPSNRSLSRVETELLRQLNLAVKSEVPWTRFNRILRQGGTPKLVEGRTPPTTEPRLSLPEWAAERAASFGADAIDRIRALGVLVEGDLDLLAAPVAASTESIDPVHHVPIDAVVELLDGMLTTTTWLDDHRARPAT